MSYEEGAISPLPTVFSTCLDNFLLFSSNLKLSSANCFNLDLCKILSSGNGLKTSSKFRQNFYLFTIRHKKLHMSKMRPSADIITTTYKCVSLCSLHRVDNINTTEGILGILHIFFFFQFVFKSHFFFLQSYDNTKSFGQRLAQVKVWDQTETLVYFPVLINYDDFCFNLYSLNFIKCSFPVCYKGGKKWMEVSK